MPQFVVTLVGVDVTEILWLDLSASLCVIQTDTSIHVAFELIVTERERARERE